MRDGLAALGRRFDRVFVISLPRAAERRARLAERLRGLQFELHLGIDWRDLSANLLAREGYDEAAARRVSRLSRAMRPGQIACAISHRQIYQQMVERQIGAALILEDDACVDEAQLAAGLAALDELPADWELVYLGYSNFERVTLKERAGGSLIWRWRARGSSSGRRPRSGGSIRARSAPTCSARGCITGRTRMA